MEKWGDKPYHSLDYENKKRFSEKVYKISLAGGTTCPNRDGTLGTRGCCFCSGSGSGDFAATKGSITEQIEEAIARVSRYKNAGHTHRLKLCAWRGRKQWRMNPLPRLQLQRDRTV